MDKQERYDAWHRQRANTEVPFEGLNHAWHLTAAKLSTDLQGRKVRVLEVGCGRGDFAMWLSNKYPQAEVVAIDFSKAAIQVAQSRAVATASTVNFKVDDAQKLSFEECSFDYVISCECMEHVPIPVQMAQEIYRVLRPGGQFILTTENYFNGLILAWIKTWLLRTPFNSGSGVQPHENFFLFWKVKKILEQSGLKVKHMESNHFQWLLLPRTDPAKMTTEDFANPRLRRFFRPFGRHFTFCGVRPGRKGARG